MATVRLLDHVSGEDADGVDAFEFQFGSFVGGQLVGLVVRVGAFGGRFGHFFNFLCYVYGHCERMVEGFR